jgi:hypothetical protein
LLLHPITLKPKKSRIISTVLSPALQLWLRTQVEQVDTLQFQIAGGDRQILSGNIPRIFIAASGAVYQGLHLSQIQVEGTGIRINLGQVLKGKPLRLLEPVPVEGQLLLQEADLQASLQAPLLSTALTELLSNWMESDGIPHLAQELKDQQISWQQITINHSQLTLFGTLTDAQLRKTPLVIRTGLQIATPHELRLHPLQIDIPLASRSINLDHLQLDLGPEVDIHELTLTPGQLICRLRLTVIP